MGERFAPQSSMKTRGELVFDAAINVEEWAINKVKRILARSGSSDKRMEPVLESGTTFGILEDSSHVVLKKKL